jgi:hypothetical protein
MSQSEYETAVAEFIRSKGIIRCPTVCLVPTQGSVAIADRVALRRRAKRFEELRTEKMHRMNAAFLRERREGKAGITRSLLPAPLAMRRSGFELLSAPGSWNATRHGTGFSSIAGACHCHGSRRSAACRAP